MDYLILKINGWEKYNPRKDIKHPSWFAFSNRMIEDPDFFDFSHGEFKAWIYILSRASQENNATIKVNFRHAERVCGISTSDLLQAISRCQKLGLIDSEYVHERTQDVQERTDHVRTRTDESHIATTELFQELNEPVRIRTESERTREPTEQTNKQDKTRQDKTNKQLPVFDLEKIYAEYPRKEGKKKGMERLKKVVTSQEKYDQVLLATKNYRKAKEFTEHQFLMHFSTFVGVFEDWLIPEQGDQARTLKTAKNDARNFGEYAKSQIQNNPFRRAKDENIILGECHEKRND